MNAFTEPHLFLPEQPKAVAQGPKPVQAWVIPIAAQACIVFFDGPTNPGAATAPAATRLTGTIDGRALPRPVVSSALTLRTGGLRHVMLISLAAPVFADRHLRLSLAGHEAAQINPEWLQPPHRDLPALIEGLDEPGRHRLAKVFFTTAASLLGAAQSHAFDAAGRELLALLQVPVLHADLLCPLGESGALARFPVTLAPGSPLPLLVALSPDRIERIREPSLCTDDPGQWYLQVPAPYGPGHDILALLPEPLVLRYSDCGLQPLATCLEGRSDRLRQWVAGLVRSKAGADRLSQALVQELAGAADPQVTVHHLSATRTGLLVWVDITDPSRLLSGLRVEAGGITTDLRVPPTGQVRAFVAVPGAADPGAQCRLRLKYRSGRVQTVKSPVVPVFDGTVAADIPVADMGAAGHSLAQAQLSRQRPVLVVRVEDIGLRPRAPVLTLLIPLADNPDILRARATQLTGEPRWREVQVIYHCGVSRANPARQLLAQIRMTHGLSHQLVVVPDLADPTERILAALPQVQARSVLLLGAQVLPQGPGWLAAWLRALQPRHGLAMLGGTVLAPDGSVRHAGGHLGPAAVGRAVPCDQRLLGMPALDLPGAAVTDTEIVTASCVALQPKAVEILRGLTLPYPNPDIVLTSALHRLQTAGQRTRLRLRHRFVDYGLGQMSGLDHAADAATLGIALHSV